MTDSRVAQIVRAAGAQGSRRRLLAALAALGLGGVLTSHGADEAGAERPQDRLRRRTQQHRRKRRNEKRRNNDNNQNQGGGGGGGLGASNCTVCAQGCTFTSVQAAINSASAGDTISICAGRYNENLTISKNLTLIGPAPDDPAAIGGTGGSSVVIVQDGVTSTLQNLAFGLGTGTLEAGELLGGGLLNFGNVTLKDSSISECTAQHGGAIYSFGPLTLNNVGILDNTATGNGGGIFAGGQGELTTINSRLEGNKATLGGGIYAEGDVTLTVQSQVVGNTATSDGGGIHNPESQVTLDDSFVQENTAPGNGGGIYNHGTCIIQNNAVIDKNTAKNGGGVYNTGNVGVDAPLLRLNDSAITNNTASEVGGGIYNDSGTVTMQAGTVTDNKAIDAGGLFNTDGGTVTLDAESAVIENDPNDCIGTPACSA